MKKQLYTFLFLLYGSSAMADFLEIKSLEDVEPIYQTVTIFCQNYPQEALQVLTHMEQRQVLSKDEWDCVYEKLKNKNEPLVDLLTKSVRGAVVLHEHVKYSLEYLGYEENKIKVINLFKSEPDSTNYLEAEKSYLTLVNDLRIIKTLINHYLYYQTNLYKK